MHFSRLHVDGNLKKKKNGETINKYIYDATSMSRTLTNFLNENDKQ